MGGGNDAERRIAQSIESLTEDEQRSLIVELVDYASYLIRTQARWTSRGVLPRGYDEKGLALEAILRVLDGRRREWDPEKEPTLTAYLKSVVKSIFSSEILPAAQRELAEIPAIDGAGRDLTAEAPSPRPSPGEEAEIDELKERLFDSFELGEDQLVLMCLFEEITAPAAIAEETGLSRGEVNRIKQKIKRRLVGLREGGSNEE